MPTLAEIAVGVGTALGSAIGAYAMAKRRKKSDPPDSGAEGPGGSDLRKDIRAALIAIDQISNRLSVVEQRLSDEARASMPYVLGEKVREDLDELERDLRAVRKELGGYLTIEEFRAYAQMMGEKLERLIEKVGKLLGTVDILVRDMRRYER